MAFRFGKESKVIVNEFDLTSYFSSADMDASTAELNATVFGEDGHRVKPGMRQGSARFGGFADFDANTADDRLAAIRGDADVLAIFAPEGDTLGSPAEFLEALLMTYKITDTVGELKKTDVELTGDDGLDVGKVLHALDAVSTTANDTGVDFDVATTGGAAAQLHVITNSRDGTLDVKVQHSTDDAVYVDLITFTQIAASTVGKEKLKVTGSVNRYLRCSYTIGGSSGSISFIVTAGKR